MPTYPVQFDIEFLPNTFGGRFIAFEGIDGSGKTTQAERVVEALKKKGKKVVYTKEPTDEPTGKLARRILSGELKVPPVALQYIFCADRAVHIEQIKQWLKEEYIVITDRYFWTAVAYGVADMHETSDYFLTIFSILSFYHRFITPDKTIYLDIETDVALKRIEKSSKHKDIYDKKDTLIEIQKSYAALLKKFPEEFVTVNGDQEIEKVTEQIIGLL